MDKSLKRVFEIYVVAFAFFFAARPLADPDFWWHLKTGEYIIHHGAIPKADLFSFTNYGKPWVAHEWLSEAIFYAIYSSLGFNALIFIFAFLTAIAFWIVFKRSNSHPFIAGFATLLGVWAVLPTVGVRPRLFTLLLASVYLAILNVYAQHGKGRAIWWTVPLMVLWVNLHGGFLIGLVLIALTMLGILLDAWAVHERITPLWPRLRTLGFVLLGCCLVVLLNPYGPRIYAFPFEIFLSPIQQQAIVDWLSPDFHQSESLPLALLILLTIGALVLSPRRPRPSELLIFLATMYATLKSRRHVAIFALVAVPLFANYLQSWLTATPVSKFLTKPRPASSRRSSIVLSLLLLLPLLPFVAKLRSKVFASPRQEVMEVPLQAVQYMKENKIIGNTFTDPNIWSGLVIWELPSNPVYIDGRIDMYGDQFVKEFLEIIFGLADWRGPFDRYGVRVVIVKPKSMLSRELQSSSDWQQVYEDEMAIVFNRR